MEQDDLDRFIAEQTAQNPDYPRLLQAAERARELTRMLADVREQTGITQEELAKKMGSSQSAISQLERGERDPRLSTITRYAEFVGLTLGFSKVA